MEQDNIIRMAREAGFEVDRCSLEWRDRIKRFADLVCAAERERIANDAQRIIKRAEARGAAAEREACAKICEDGTALDAFLDGVESYNNEFECCAAVIRARGNNGH